MSIKAILTTLILGSSSLALAAPHGGGYGPVVRDHRGGFEGRARNFQGRDFHRDYGGRPGYAREDHERRERPVVRERWERPYQRERWERPYYVSPSPYYVSPPVVYNAPMTPFVNGAMSISLGGVAASGVALSSNGGETYVQQVLVTYIDGRTQVVDIERELDSDDAPIQIGTDGTPVAAVTIYGSGSGVSAWAI